MTKRDAGEREHERRGDECSVRECLARDEQRNAQGQSFFVRLPKRKVAQHFLGLVVDHEESEWNGAKREQRERTLCIQPRFGWVHASDYGEVDVHLPLGGSSGRYSSAERMELRSPGMPPPSSIRENSTQTQDQAMARIQTLMCRSTLLALTAALAFTGVASGPTLACAQSFARLEGDHFVFATPLTFESGATISPDAESALADVVRVLSRRPEMKVKISVHTDSRGSSAYNLRSSQVRADAIRTWIEAHGIGPGRIHTQGFGETMPIDTNATATGRARNSRVEIRVLPPR